MKKILSIILTLTLSATVFAQPLPKKLEHNEKMAWSSLHLGYLGAMFLLICVFILARYRKARVQALLNRYRRSKHISAVQAYFLFLLPFVLFFLETWLFDEWGWTDCVRWNK